jgi:lipid-binding SYLF domain-containing protein
MSLGSKISIVMLVAAVVTASPPNVKVAHAGSARQEGLLLTATEVLDDVQGMPDQRVPDALLARAYGIAVIPSVTKIAFIFGGRYGTGVVVVRDKLDAPWSNPVFLSLTGGSWGLQAGAQASDIILVFTTRNGIEGIAGGRMTLGADASVAAGPVGRQASASTDIGLAEIYSYARTRGLFAGIAVDGSVIAIDRSANAALYHKSGVTASEIFSGKAPAPPESAQRFLNRLSQLTHSPPRTAPAPQADMPNAASPAPVGAPAAPAAPAPAPAAPPRTYPLENQN